MKTFKLALSGLLIMIGATALTLPNADDEGMQYLSNGLIKVGIDLKKGGAITHVSSNINGINLINSYDLGRQVQMSFYSGPIPFNPPGTTLSKAWEKLGWNPIQTGDYAGNMSKVIGFRKSRNALYVKLIPMQSFYRPTTLNIIYML